MIKSIVMFEGFVNGRAGDNREGKRKAGNPI